MTKQEFIKKLFLRKDDLVTNFDFQKEVLLDLLKTGFIYVNYHYANEENKFANMMLQMSLLKANSIIQLSEGAKLWKLEENQEHLIDIQSQSSVFRSLYENYCFFNHLYIQKWTNEEFLILNNIWRITSLNQRFKLVDEFTNPLSVINEEKIDKEKSFVKELTNEIKKTSIYNKNKKVIDNILKRNRWQITIIDDSVSSISWIDMYNNTMKNKRRDDRTYNIFSLDAHPTYYSVFQFGDLYKKRHDLDRRTTLMYQTIELICNYLFDFQLLIKEKEEIIISNESKYLIEILGKNKEHD